MEKQERDKRIPILLTEDEKRELEKAAGKAGLPVSTWVRWVSLQEARNAGG